jgi:hypothetical protein
LDEGRKQQGDRLYERYGRPLEDQHRGEYVAISPDGQTILGSSVGEVLREAKATFGPGNFVFKIGEKSVGKWRQSDRARTRDDRKAFLAAAASWRDLIDVDEFKHQIAESRGSRRPSVVL